MAATDDGYSLLLIFGVLLIVLFTGIGLGAVFTRWWIERQRDRDMNTYYRSFRDDRHDGGIS